MKPVEPRTTPLRNGVKSRSALGQRRGQTSVEERGDQIVETATRLFSERGYSATRLNDIAVELGVTRAALYYYFPRGKVEILELVCAAGMDRAERVLGAAVRHPDPVVALTSFMTEYASHITSGEARVFFRETSELDPAFRRGLMDRARELTVRVVELLQRGIDDGALRDDFDPETAANAIFGTLNWMSQWHSQDALSPAAAATGASFADLFLRGVQPAPAA
jgi:AcrR family transcriptional regulator